jgi:hypothetical protein
MRHVARPESNRIDPEAIETHNVVGFVAVAAVSIVP